MELVVQAPTEPKSADLTLREPAKWASVPDFIFRNYHYVRDLESLTGRDDLISLTALQWLCLTGHYLTRKSRAWCPKCFQEWMAQGLPIYEKFVWTIEMVKLCNRHLVPLVIHCPHKDCNKTLPLVDKLMNPGFCSRCHRWLGVESSLPLDLSTSSKRNSRIRYTQLISKPTSELPKSRLMAFGADKIISSRGGCARGPHHWHFCLTDREWQIWLVRSIGDLHVKLPHIISRSRQIDIPGAIQRYVSLAFDGNYHELAARLNLPVSTISDWCNERSIFFNIENLFYLCRCLNINPSSFITEEWHDQKLRNLSNMLYNRISLDKDLTLTKAYRTLSSRIGRYLDDDMPPYSLDEIAESLGYNQDFLLRFFPESCKSIITRFATIKTNTHIQTLRNHRNEVRNAVLESVRYGEMPRLSEIKRKLTSPDSIKNKLVLSAWHQALHELGIKPYNEEPSELLL